MENRNMRERNWKTANCICRSDSEREILILVKIGASNDEARKALADCAVAILLIPILSRFEAFPITDISTRWQM